MKRFSIAILLILGSCTGAKFIAPDPTMPSEYLGDSDTTSLSLSVEWWESFNDPYLNSLITQALDSNRTLAQAYSRILASRLELSQARSLSAPTLSLGVSAGADYTASTKIVQSYSIEPAISWEIDLFGKLRHSAQATLAEMLSTEAEYQALRLSLAAQVATSYFAILEYDLAIKISQNTLLSRQNSAELFSILSEYGEISDITLQQNQGLVASAQSTLESYQLSRTEAINSLCVLLGTNPQEMDFSAVSLLNYTIPEPIPAGLPTELLSRRADIVESYYTLKSTYSKIGVAIANRFPSLTLTGSGGLISSSISSLFSANPWGWSSALSLTEPIFAFGRNKRAVDIAKIERDEALFSYEESVLTALSEVQSALYGVSSYREQVIALREFAVASKIAEELTAQLYDAGQDSYLDLLDAQREYFTAQLEYAAILSKHLTSYVTLYKALGGGYQNSAIQTP